MEIVNSKQFDMVDHFKTLAPTLWSGEGEALRAVREARLADFVKHGIPSTKNDDWRFMNLTPFTTTAFVPARLDPNQAKTDLAVKRYQSPSDINILIKNGSLVKDLPKSWALPTGVRIAALQELAKTNSNALIPLLTAMDMVADNTFAALNDCLWQNGVLIDIENSASGQELIHIIHLLDDATQPVISSPRVIINVGRAASVVIMETFCSTTRSKITTWSNSLTDIHLSENATCRYFQNQAEATKALHTGMTRVVQDTNSRFSSYCITTGGAVTRNDLAVELKGEGADAALYGIYSISDTQLVDNHTNIRHLTPRASSNQVYKGILAQAGHAVFNGKIYVHPSAQGTNSFQVNNNLLLGEQSRVNTKPQLEIFADDVKCSHGATVGQLNEEEVLYLQMRGIAKQDAVKMLTQGFVDDILMNIQSVSAKEKLALSLQPTIAAALN